MEKLSEEELCNRIFDLWTKRVTEIPPILVPNLFQTGDGKDFKRAVDALVSTAALLKEKKLSKKLIHKDLLEKLADKDDAPLVDERHLSADGKVEQQKDVQNVRPKEVTIRRALYRCSLPFFEEIKNLTLEGKKEILKHIAREWSFDPKCLYLTYFLYSHKVVHLFNNSAADSRSRLYCQ